jgi:signal transduction histidine kinase
MKGDEDKLLRSAALENAKSILAARQRAEQRSEAYLAEAQKLSHTGSIGWKVSTGEIIWSEETFRIFQYERSTKPTVELILQRVHPEDAALVQQTIERAAQDGENFEHEYRLVMPDGSVKYVHVVARASNDELGSIDFVGAVMDITERKRAEMLLGGEKRLLEMIARGDSRVAILDALCRLVETLANGSLCSILLLDWNTNRLRHGAAPSLPVAYTAAIDGIAIGPSVGSCGTAAYRAERVTVCDIAADLLWADYRDVALAHGLRACWSAPILSSEGRVLGTFATYYREPRIPTPYEQHVIERITHLASIAIEGEQSEEALRQAQREIARVSRVNTMGELTASVAHEVNQPIAAAITDANTCLRWLAGDAPNLEEARAAAMRVVKDSRRAAEIISRIRLLFKKGVPERELVDVNEVIREMIILLRNEAAQYSISIHTDFVADCHEVMADRVQLQQVLMNLMINGIDAMKDVNGARELVINSQRADSEQVQVSIRDTGVGLPPQQANQVFNAFFTTKPHGTGMGLRISRSIVESHGGRIWAGENSPCGACFYFTLPVKTDSHADAPES